MRYHRRNKKRSLRSYVMIGGRIVCGLAAALALGLAIPADAQLPVDLPDLPTGRVDDVLRDRIDRTRDQVDELREDVEDTRRETLDTLLRQNPDVLERGPDRSVIVRNQITVLAESRSALGLVLGQGFALVRDRPLPGLGLSLFVLEAPPGLSTRRALDLARRIDPGGLYDFNHIYTRSGHAAALVSAQSAPRHLRVGLVDTGVEPGHPALAGFRVSTRAFHGAAYLPAAHGTAVASLIGGGYLYSADIYGDGPTGGSLDALVAALGWMSEQGVAVVNVSLVGPENRLLERVVSLLLSRGHIVVAAVGNDGPSARPLYPAAYDGVTGVTGIGERGRILPEAGRGDHVDFAAPGAFPRAARASGGYGPVRGTSYAAPLVAAMLASRLDRPDPAAARRALDSLRAEARDAGRRGRDNTYGHGVVGEATFRTAASGN
ncbi:S8 family serine peptidase [Maricaulis sp.]|uniref:S8 family serine peptidase n=1 Tax=Maricaulis sp. TaxID=1486257 RepID=UPI0026329576|nr:S8 family serine peptidase [Maricaulis sp.]